MAIAKNRLRMRLLRKEEKWKTFARWLPPANVLRAGGMGRVIQNDDPLAAGQVQAAKAGFVILVNDLRRIVVADVPGAGSRVVAHQRLKMVAAGTDGCSSPRGAGPFHPV